MFNCIKTGFYAALPNGLFLYGDAFGMSGEDWPNEPVGQPDAYLLLRVASMSDEEPARIHFRLHTWAHWFEEFRGRNLDSEGVSHVWQPSSTLIADPGQWKWLGYSGVPVS